MEDVGEPLVDENFGHGRYAHTAVNNETKYDIISWK